MWPADQSYGGCSRLLCGANTFWLLQRTVTRVGTQIRLVEDRREAGDAAPQQCFILPLLRCLQNRAEWLDRVMITVRWSALFLY